jgi:hypothetical protein
VDWTSNNIAAVIVSGIATIIAGISLGLSCKANRISNAALDETRRRNLLDRRPSLVVVTRPDEGRRGQNYCRVNVRNSGPGVAEKVEFGLNWPSLETTNWGERPVEDSVGSLAVGECQELPRNAPCTVTAKDGIWGTMTCEDGAGTRYWWHRAGPDAEWESGTGSPPEGSVHA